MNDQEQQLTHLEKDSNHEISVINNISNENIVLGSLPVEEKSKTVKINCEMRNSPAIKNINVIKNKKNYVGQKKDKYLHHLEYDTLEFVLKANRYKTEIMKNCNKMHILKDDIHNLQNIYDYNSEEYTSCRTQLDVAQDTYAKVKKLLKEKLAKKGELMKEIMTQRRNRDNIMKENQVLCDEISSLKVKAANLEDEVAKNYKKWKEAIFETGRLNLESSWFEKERILLEKEIEYENENYNNIKREIDDLRCTLRNSWTPIELESRKILKDTKLRTGGDDWYASRISTLKT